MALLYYNRRKTIDIYLLLKISKILNHNLVEEICAKYGIFNDISLPKISFVLEVNLEDDKALKSFLKAIKQLDIQF